jgi:hypothetical protein
MDVHRGTLERLRVWDKQFTGQWVGANLGNTASAGLGIASAVLLFLAPPVGAGLGIGSAVAGGLTFAGDSLADSAHCADLRRQLSKDTWNSFVVSELLKEWVQARQALRAAASESDVLMERPLLRTISSASEVSFGGPSPRCTVGCGGGDGSSGDVGDALDTGLTAGAVVDGGAVMGVRVADGLGKTAAAASQVLGVAGALISTGFAIRGWSTIKAGHAAVRAKKQELTLRLLQIQHLLASLDRLECPICADDITLSDTVRHCSGSMHCFHATCLSRLWGGVASSSSACPVCCDPMEQEFEMLVDSVDRFRSKSSSEKDAGRRRRESAPQGALPHALALRGGVERHPRRVARVATGCC